MFAFAAEQFGLEWVKPLPNVKVFNVIMIRQLKWPIALATGLLAATLGLRAIETTPALDAAVKAATSGDTNKTATATTLAPGPNDGRIAHITAQVMSRFHYSQHPLDDNYSEEFFERYLESLDPQHLHFTQADVAEFEHYRDQLDDLTVSRRGEGDVKPAFEIFTRFLQRLEQRVAFAEERLKKEKFEFNTDEKLLINRKDEAYPKDLAAAKELWDQRLRFEYLQEKLAKVGAKKKKEESPGSIIVTDPKTGEKVTKPLPPQKTSESVKPASKFKNDAEEIVDTLSRRYARNLHFFKDWDNEDVVQVYLTALTHVYDPHSDYMNKIQADNFAIGMNLALIGIGAELYSDDGYCTIRRVMPGGPAEKSKKIKEKDRIVAVAQSDAPPVDCVDMALNKVVQMIRGPRKTEVRLTIQPADGGPADRYVLPLVREEIKLEDQEVKAKVIEVPDARGRTVRLGVIDLPSFYATMGRGESDDTRTSVRSTTTDVAKLLKKLEQEKIAGVILDLRRNGGGSLEEATALSSLFVSGPIVQIRDGSGELNVLENPKAPEVYSGPLIVLTSRFSASASEIVAGALQDYGRALLVGDSSTFGKGTVQRLFGLKTWVKPATATATNDPGQLKITMSKYYRPSGNSTLYKGVLPDIVLPSPLNYAEDIGEESLESGPHGSGGKSKEANPLAHDSVPVPRAPYQKQNNVMPVLADLLQRSTQRIGTNQDYAYIREDIELFRKNQEDKTISLNEKQRLKEKDEADARQKARDKERLARKEASEKVYELGLKQVELPGLPPPLQKTNSSVAKAAANSGAGAVNSASVAAKARTGDADEEDEDEKPPAVDATLEETEHILVDYISLLAQKGFATTSPGANSN